MTHEALDGLNDPAVRDLAWSLLCPPLYRIEQDHPHPFPQPDHRWLQTLDHGPASLHAHLAQHPTNRLGIYHEQLVEYYLNNTSQLTDINKGVRIKKGNITQGELDFLYRFQGEARYTHLEISFKFFLRLVPGLSPEYWIGPNPSDRLDLKLDRMFNHQLPLGRSELMRSLYPQLPVAGSLGVIRGCLFYPYEGWSHRAQPPKGCSPGHWHGWWIRQPECDRLGEAPFWLLDRRQWLTPVRCQDSAQLVGGTQLKSIEVERPLMVARMVESKEGWREQDRGFILPRSWPDDREL